MSSEALNQRFLYIPRKALIVSAVLHLMVPTSFVVVKVLDHFGIHLFRKPVQHQTYKDFIQVDMVGLPDQLIKDMAQTDATLDIVDKPRTEAERRSETAPKPDEMSLGAQSKKQAEEEALKAKQKKEKESEKEKEKALKKIAEEAKREAALKALSKKNGKQGRAKIAGNMVSKGTAASGMVGSSKDRYHAVVVQRMKEHFNVYSWQRKKGLVAVVQIELYPTGRLRAKRVIKPSTDRLYDSAVLQAVENAQPYPIPDDTSLIGEPITVEFRPEE